MFQNGVSKLPLRSSIQQTQLGESTEARSCFRLPFARTVTGHEAERGQSWGRLLTASALSVLQAQAETQLNGKFSLWFPYVFLLCSQLCSQLCCGGALRGAACPASCRSASFAAGMQ